MEGMGKLYNNGGLDLITNIVFINVLYPEIMHDNPVQYEKYHHIRSYL